jgi:hypothetical protein
VKKKRHRKELGFLAVTLASVFLALGLTYRSWAPVYFKQPDIEREAVKTLKPRSLELPLPDSGIQTAILQRLSFDKGQESLMGWQEKVFKGTTVFKIIEDDGSPYLRSQSQDACSGLYVKTEHRATPDLWISWKWRAKEFPHKKRPELLSNRPEDDFAARVYVIFPASNFFRSDVIEYIWDKEIPSGTLADSPYSERVKLLVVRTGPPGVVNGGWVEEERNIYEDYLKLFGKAPRHPVGLVALMSDSDNTGTSASADFAEIILKDKQQGKGGIHGLEN